MQQERILAKISLPGNPNTLEVKISYSLGGMNYFQSKVEERGLYIHVTPYHCEGPGDSFQS